METGQEPANSWMDKQNLYTHNEILYRHKKEWSSDTCYSKTLKTLKKTHQNLMLGEARHKGPYITWVHLQESPE